MHCMPACFFGIAATPAGGTEQSFVLSSPETYTEANICLPSSTPARVNPSSVRRLETLPGIKGLTIVGKYPIADVSYDIAGLVPPASPPAAARHGACGQCASAATRGNRTREVGPTANACEPIAQVSR